jgi:tetratricopeptide (TPR) repeat protein
VISFHGLVTDVIYGVWGAPLLFVIPGYAVSIAQNGYPNLENRNSIGIPVLESKSFLRYGIILIVIGLLFTAYRFRNQIQAQWFANLGAVKMSRVELASWPINQLDDGSNAGKLINAERYLQEALAYNPDNRTANHRLGLIAMVNRDYTTAITYLESAADLDQNHPGITKNLGYSYLWANQSQKAHAMLSELPEARQELGVYVWWWGTLGRTDLAETAQSMLDYFRAQD